jgi:outer membrane murein-binding lipoprotein Lpp
MIDFRYHLVSLVSVFMALAIGVVLGAGPLKESLGDTLTSQVQALRADKEALQQAVDNRDAELAGKDAVITDLSTSLLPQQLAGRSVALVLLPGAEQETVDALLPDLATAGATVTTTVTVQPKWTDPAEAAFRSELAGQLVQYLETPPAASVGTDGELAALLGSALLTTEDGGAERGASLSQALDGLVAGELVTVAEETQRRSELALVVAGPPDESVGVDDPEWAQAASSSMLTLLAQLDTEGDGTVVVAPRTSDVEGGLLSEVRADAALTEVVSSVDGVSSPGGRLSTVLALREQAEGRAGQYGTGESAQVAAPPYSPPATAQTPGGGSTGTPTGDG